MTADGIKKGEQATKEWQDYQALERFQMISPLLDESLDNAIYVEFTNMDELK